MSEEASRRLAAIHSASTRFSLALFSGLPEKGIIYHLCSPPAASLEPAGGKASGRFTRDLPFPVQDFPMFHVIGCITQEHDLRLVVLAGVLCLLASTTALSMLARARAASARPRAYWIAGAGTVAAIRCCVKTGTTGVAAAAAVAPAATATAIRKQRRLVTWIARYARGVSDSLRSRKGSVGLVAGIFSSP